MTLFGAFREPGGGPFVTGTVTVHATGVAWEVDFFLDTGADVSVLMSDDARELGLDVPALPRSAVVASGVGGEVGLRTVAATLTFSDAERSYLYRMDLPVIEPGPYTEGVPSLLGRDILNRWLLRYEAPRDILEAEVDTADAVIPRSP